MLFYQKSQRQTPAPKERMLDARVVNGLIRSVQATNQSFAAHPTDLEQLATLPGPSLYPTGGRSQPRTRPDTAVRIVPAGMVHMAQGIPRADPGHFAPIPQQLLLSSTLVQWQSNAPVLGQFAHSQGYPAPDVTQNQRMATPLPRTEHQGSSQLNLRSMPDYRIFDGFAIDPKQVTFGTNVFSFAVSEDDFRRAGTSSTETQYRLRACKLEQGTDWISCPTVWPTLIGLALNENTVCHRGYTYRDPSPIDVTNLLHPGVNTLKVCLYERFHDKNDTSTYSVAVEITRVDRAAIRKRVEENGRFGIDETKKKIKRMLLQGYALRFAVIDPHRSTLFTTPVRGVACEHVECFDLDTWSEASQSVRDWECPICGSRANPLTLRIDNYFVEVLKKLREEGPWRTGIIDIERNGEWSRVAPSRSKRLHRWMLLYNSRCDPRA